MLDLIWWSDDKHTLNKILPTRGLTPPPHTHTHTHKYNSLFGMPFFGPCHCFFVLFFPPLHYTLSKSLGMEHTEFYLVNSLNSSWASNIMGPNTYPVPNMSSLVTEMPELPTVPWACLCRIRHNCISRDFKLDRSLRILRQRQLIVGKIELRYGLMVPTGRVLKLNWTPASSLGTSPAQPRKDTRALQSWRRRKLKNSLALCFLAIMATFLYSEGKNISCLQYKSLQARSYADLASLTPKEPPFTALCVF